MPECCLFLANAGRSLHPCAPQLPLLQEMVAAPTFWGCRQKSDEQRAQLRATALPSSRLASCQELDQESGMRVSILGTSAGRVRQAGL